jgi:hypothetical protein
MSKPAPLPNVHPSCVVQVIDESKNHPQWKTIGSCYDAPNPIAAVLRKHGLNTAWVRDCLGDRRMVSI